MKPLSILFLLLLFSCTNEPQKKPAASASRKDSAIVKSIPLNPYADVDLSPMDISYFPKDYPILKMSKKVTSAPQARVIYSRPHKQGRKIFGALLKYGEPWRLGANEATEIEFFQPVTIQNQRVPKGRYNMYCIPYEKTWAIILNKNIFSWGLRHDPKEDLFKFETTVRPSNAPIEFFTMVFDPTATGADLIVAWDEVITHLPIQF